MGLSDPTQMPPIAPIAALTALAVGAPALATQEIYKEFKAKESEAKCVTCHVEKMPTVTSRICGTCPHAHHLAAAKAVDSVFGIEIPPAAKLLRELLNAGSIIHSHAIHFFALAGPAVGREIGEGETDLRLRGRAAGDDEAGERRDRHGDKQCFLQERPPWRRCYL